jgi:uncharacterized membrane protein YoaK (UPF0700 family)
MNNSKYTGLGIALGAAFGTLAGIFAGQVAIWLPIGIAIGVAIGTSFRRKGSVCRECAEIHRTHETNLQLKARS